MARHHRGETQGTHLVEERGEGGGLVGDVAAEDEDAGGVGQVQAVEEALEEGVARALVDKGVLVDGVDELQICAHFYQQHYEIRHRWLLLGSFALGGVVLVVMTILSWVGCVRPLTQLSNLDQP